MSTVPTPLEASASVTPSHVEPSILSPPEVTEHDSSLSIYGSHRHEVLRAARAVQAKRGADYYPIVFERRHKHWVAYFFTTRDISWAMPYDWNPPERIALPARGVQ